MPMIESPPDGLQRAGRYIGGRWGVGWAWGMGGRLHKQSRQNILQLRWNRGREWKQWNKNGKNRVEKRRSKSVKWAERDLKEDRGGRWLDTEVEVRRSKRWKVKPGNVWRWWLGPSTDAGRECERLHNSESRYALHLRGGDLVDNRLIKTAAYTQYLS